MPEAQKTPHDRFVEAALAAGAQPRPVFETGIPMRDGIELAADVYLPTEQERSAPAVVTMTPYDKSGLFVAPEGRLYQERGYAYVAVDLRGRGKSEGEWRAFVHDGRDGHDVIEWVAAQPWCTGKVGTTGLSYMGWTQWATAAERPPHLTCMISTSAAGRWQQEIPYTDGCFQLYFGWWVYAVRRRISELHSVGEVDWDQVLSRLPLEAIGEFINPAGQTWRDIMDHDTLDNFWRAIRFDDRYQEIDVPCLHVTGWYDLEDLLGAFHHYEGMMAASPARERQRLIAGPWSHVNSRYPHSSYAGIEFGPEAALEMNEIHLAWCDYWLKGQQNAVMQSPPVLLFETGTNRWRDASAWPLATGEWSLYLGWDGGDGHLTGTPEDEAQPDRSYRYDPRDPTPTRLDVKRYPIEDVPIVMNEIEQRPDVITYTSAPLAQPLTVSGWPHLELWASSDRDDTEWHVKLTDVDENGRSVKVCQGCLRASYRDSLEHPTPLTPGVPHRFRIELWPVHHTFLPGHRIRVSITSSDYPWFARSLNQFGPLKDQSEPLVAINTIHHGGEYSSRVILPVEENPTA
jgi:putative CocE/NonD family hydrolase